MFEHSKYSIKHIEFTIEKRNNPEIVLNCTKIVFVIKSSTIIEVKIAKQ